MILKSTILGHLSLDATALASNLFPANRLDSVQQLVSDTETVPSHLRSLAQPKHAGKLRKIRRILLVRHCHLRKPLVLFALETCRVQRQVSEKTVWEICPCILLNFYRKREKGTTTAEERWECEEEPPPIIDEEPPYWEGCDEEPERERGNEVEDETEFAGCDEVEVCS